MRGPTSTGDISDPVAQSIRNEQMADAAPSKKDRAEAQRQNATCDRCGDHDPETVSRRFPESYHPSCGAIQTSTRPIGFICNDCYEPTSKSDAIENRFLNDADAKYVVEYECGALKAYDSEYDGDGPRPRYWQPSVPVAHRCGEAIATVHERSEFESNS